MPGSGMNAANLKLGKRMLEHCRFAYKAYAQSCEYPLDPFYEAHGLGGDAARTRLLEDVHTRLGTRADATKFDPVPYRLAETPNPHRGVVYRAGIAAERNQFVLFQPRPLDMSIASARGFNLKGQPVDAGHALPGATGALRCAYFQGRTGMTQTHPTAGWTSWLGAVLYDPGTQEAVVIFRGSRSGSGFRALTQAQFKSKGSPDWVTDMNHLKSVAVPKYNNAKLSCGFHYAYESCKTSLLAAYRHATSGSTPTSILITGHSLGGALATCAYLDFTCGDMARDVVLANTVLQRTFNVRCFPISAPPVVIGRASHQLMSFDCDASQITHYFCPKDVVHASPLVEFSGMKFGNAVIQAFTHPNTDPFHLGTEIGLPCTQAFPDAHEPEEVWKAMSGGTSDPLFWHRFDIDPLAQGRAISGVPGPMEAACKAALAESVNPALGQFRATEWTNVVKSESRMETLGQRLGGFTLSTDVTTGIRNSTNPIETMAMQRILERDRNELLQRFSGAKGHRASSAAYWTLLQTLAVEAYI